MDPFDLSNVFLIYFKKVFQKSKDHNMFTEVDYSKYESTSRAMEMYYYEVLKYKERENDADKIDIFPFGKNNIDTCDELYKLVVDTKEGQLEYESQSLVSLLKLVSELDYDDSVWTVYPLKCVH